MKKISQFEPLFGDEEALACSNYIKSGGWITEFKKTAEFESEIAKFTGAKHCIATNNGTISLSLALMAYGLGPEDEFLVPDLTMIATANAGKFFGAKPVFVDVEPHHLCIALRSAEQQITSKTKALIYVSLNGRCGDMEAVRTFCRKHNLFFLEDAAQALGSYYQGTHLGRFGNAGSFSFSMPKIISTGQGGAIITDEDELAYKIRRLKDFGRSKGGLDVHDTIGYNFKFTDLQAVIGLEQFKKLDSRIKRKKRIFEIYHEQLGNISGIEFLPTDLSQTTPWFMDIYSDHAPDLAGFLKEKGIGTRPIYPALHTQKIYCQSGDYPNAAHAARRGLWLPSSVQLKDEEVEYICGQIKDFLNERMESAHARQYLKS